MLTRDFSKICVITTICGSKFNKLYKAPTICHSYVFTNNVELEKECKLKGWTYIKLTLDLSSDEIISSNQAKYVKFLQFFNDKNCDYMKKYDIIIYVDHKFYFKNDHIGKLLDAIKQPILIRKTPSNKALIWDEFRDAHHQLRYRQFEEKAKNYVNDKIKNGYTENVRISNTGLIVYNVKNEQVIKLVNEIYVDLQRVGTPECQIIWAMVSQKYQNIIQQIEWNDVPILWQTP